MKGELTFYFLTLFRGGGAGLGKSHPLLARLVNEGYQHG